MGSEWTSLTIGDLVRTNEATVQTGPFGSQLHSHDYVASGTAVIPTEAIGRGRILDVEVPQVGPEKAAELSRHRLVRGDILFARRGAQATGLSAIVDHRHEGALCGTGALLLRLSSERVEPRFLAWHLASEQSFNWLRTHAVGAVMPNLNTDIIKTIPLLLPAIDEQKRLARFLDNIDDRIALLRETNATLEAIAQALFKSWFVDFDPVRAKSQGLAPAGMDEAMAALFPDGFEESEKGAVPKGWRWISLRDAVSIHDSKRIPLSGQDRAKRRGPFPYYGAAALMDHVDDYLFEGPHVLVGEDGSVTQPDGMPVLQYVWNKFWVNNHAHVLQGANGICTEHVLLSLRTTNIQHLVTGAVQAKLSQGNMWRIDFMRPSREVAGAFASVIEPLFARFRQNAEQAHSLAEIRETLLPRLISGQLRLPEAEEAIAEATHAD